MSSKTPNRRIAVLIDGDNAQPKLLTQILEEVSRHGSVTIRRIYGDWTSNSMKGWKEQLNTNAIQPIQQFAYTRGKNATDSSMIIDAMDILHGKLVDGFCIVSSDSDYTRLATRIREEGYFVMGIGQKKTPEPFVRGVELFIFTENMIADEEEDKKKKKVDKSKIIPLLKKAYYMVVGEEDQADLSQVGAALRKIDPGFDVREYGHHSLKSMFKSLSHRFEVIKDGKTTYISETKHKK